MIKDTVTINLGIVLDKEIIGEAIEFEGLTWDEYVEEVVSFIYEEGKGPGLYGVEFNGLTEGELFVGDKDGD